jgi:uncharacterized glyoxalase superfamily protein PhnB
VRRNRSIPDATVIPVLTVVDVRAAVAWLSEAFGFSERLQIGEGHRSQLDVPGGGAVIVGDAQGARVPPRAGEAPQSVMVRVSDARAHRDRARRAGARIIREPTDFPYGERQYDAEDPFGHRWTFSETIADADPAEWGGELKG